MSWYADLDTHTMVAFGDHVRAIGWLSSGKSFHQGNVSEQFVARLCEFVQRAGRSSSLLSFPSFGGFHECELCEQSIEPQTLRPKGAANFGVPCGVVLYVAPELILHYVQVHNYQPPDEFIAAVLASPLPDTPEYQVMVESFAQLHRDLWQQMLNRWRTQQSDPTPSEQ